MELVQIAALSENYVIGNNGGIPWNIPEDVQHFRDCVSGSPLIVGRKTFSDWMKNHSNHIFVLSRSNISFKESDIHVAESKSQAIELLKQYVDSDDTVYVIGGENIYREFLPQSNRMILSFIPNFYEGDTYFPKWDANNWVVSRRENHTDFVVYEFVRVNDE